MHWLGGAAAKAVKGSGPRGSATIACGVRKCLSRRCRGAPDTPSRAPRWGLMPASVSSCVTVTYGERAAHTRKKSMVLFPHVGRLGAWITPCIISGHLDARRSSGEFCQSAAIIHMPSSAMTYLQHDSRRARFFACAISRPDHR